MSFYFPRLDFSRHLPVEAPGEECLVTAGFRCNNFPGLFYYSSNRILIEAVRFCRYLVRISDILSV